MPTFLSAAALPYCSHVMSSTEGKAERRGQLVSDVSIEQEPGLPFKSLLRNRAMHHSELTGPEINSSEPITPHLLSLFIKC